MAGIHLGCSGWSYPDWVGPFYPPGTPAGEFLERYARVFSFVEVDSSHYAPPERSTVERWARVTPPGFRFAVKAPGILTHDARLRGVETGWSEFVEAMEPLREAGKLACVLLQFPASFRRPDDGDAFDAFLGLVPSGLRVAVEFRHASWWTPKQPVGLSERKVAFAWSVNDLVDTPPLRTADFVYMRFIGDRKLTRFDRIQRDETPTMERWRDRLLGARDAGEDVYAIVNNHLMGFAPATARSLASILGLVPPDLTKAHARPEQRLDGF